MLALAWRNVLRNRRRSLITATSVTIGLAAMIFLWGFVDGMNRQMVDNTTRFFAGDMQVHLKGYHDDPSLDLTIADPDRLLRAVRGHPGVAAASVRMEGSALASSGDKARGVRFVGVRPDEEARVTALASALIMGDPLSDSARGVLIGEKLASALAVQPGDDLVFVGQAYDGSIASGRFPVRGVFRTKIEELDGYVAVMPIEAVREFYAAPDGATTIALRLDDLDEVAAAGASIASGLGERFEVLGWPRLLPMVAVSVRFHEVFGYVVLLVFFVVVAAAVANPVLIAVLERTREFGTMLALGMSAGRLLRLVLLESLLIGIVGLLAGNVIGVAATSYFESAGIDLGAFEAGMRTMPGLSDYVFPVVRADRSVMLSGFVIAVTFLAALYPAAKAAKLDPIEAIRGLPRAGKARNRDTVASAPWPVFILIASRNLVRNARRSLIVVAGTASGIVGFIFMLGFFDGFFEQTIENSTRYLTGHAQVERAGFRRDLAPELAISEPAALLEQLRQVPGVAAAAPRVQAQALASTAARSEGIVLVGIDPPAERRVTFIDRTIVAGEALAEGAVREVMIGRKLAERLDLRVGEKMVVMAQGADGQLGTAAYRVGGIFATESTSFDGAFAYVTLAAAQSLLGLESRVSTVNLRLDDRPRIGAALEALRAQVSTPGIAIVAWHDLLPQLAEMVEFTRVFANILLALLLLVVTAAVMNTVFMSVAERTREFGVMMALGTPPAAIRRMVVYETMLLLGIAAVVGYGLGVALVGYLGATGMDLSGFFRDFPAIPGITGIIHPRFFAATVVPPGVVLLVAGVLVSLFPANRASRLDPVAAIRHG